MWAEKCHHVHDTCARDEKPREANYQQPGGATVKSESFFTATERFCRWSSGTRGAGDAENCLVGEGLVRRDRDPMEAEKAPAQH